MTLTEIKQIVSNRLNALKAQRTLAVAAGDLERVAQLDVDINETANTLEQLNYLTG